MLKLDNVSYKVSNSYLAKNNFKNILSNISFEVSNGDILGIAGESGAGKTTLAKIIAGLLAPTSGEIERRNIELNEIQILFQNNLELINPLRKVKDILNDINKNNIHETISNVGLSINILSKFGYQLSGGERQRIALARILLAEPKLLIIDEPFSAQDEEAKKNIISILKKLNMENKVTVIIISHDIRAIALFANRLLVIKDGVIQELINNLSNYEFQNDYTKFLFNSADFKLTNDDFGHFIF